MPRKPNSRGMLSSGRSAKSAPFVKALHAIFDHPDYKALSPPARAFLWDLCRQYNGRNNGNLAASEGLMGALGYSKYQCRRLRNELKQYQWIRVTRLPRAKREPILFALTWLDVDEWEGPPYLDENARTTPRKKLK